MPKAKVTEKYQRAGSSPSERVPAPKRIHDPRPRKKRKDLYGYVKENEDTGIPLKELIEQFQLYECEHPVKEQEVIANNASTLTKRCNCCRWVRTDPRPGSKNGQT